MTTEQRFDALFSVLIRHSEIEREDAVASLFLRLRLDLTALDGPARQIFASFLERALADREDPENVFDCVASYFREHPLPTAIQKSIERAIADEAADATMGDGAFAAFVGSKLPLLQKQPKGEDDVTNSPL